MLVAVLFIGCGKPAQEASKQTQESETNAVAVAAPEKEQKPCFVCNGQGIVACRAPGCMNGKMDCPGLCLKLTRGTWIHTAVAGHDPSELWRKFPESNGGYQARSHHHVGDVIVMQNGHTVNIGPCKVCGGAAKVDCRACQGQGKQPCEMCEGKKVIPIAWTPTDSPWFNKQPDVIRLKNGDAFLGKVVGSSGEESTVRLREGKFIHVETAGILAKPQAARPPLV